MEQGQGSHIVVGLHRLYAGKLMPPSRSGELVVRTRLIERFFNNDKPVTLLMAPAGFGKTMLMTQLHQSLKELGQSVTWLSLDERDNDFSRFFIYVKEAICNLGIFGLPTVKKDVSLRESTYSDLRAESYELIDQIGSSSAAFTLFLDDYDKIQSAEVISFTTDLIRVMNPGQKLVIGSRSMRRLPLATIEVNGQMNRIDSDDLIFNLDETTLFFQKQGCRELSREDINCLQSKIDGWAAGLRLVSLGLPNEGNVSKWINDLSLSTDSISAYLSENILAKLPAKICNFMIETCILDQINGDICDAVLETNGCSQLIDEIFRANIFLALVDASRSSYAFHSIFRTFLIAELVRTRPEKIALLHRRAAVYLSSCARYAPAFEHALQANDPVLAVDILDMSAMRFVQLGQLETVSKWIATVDFTLASERPNIQRARAYASISMHHYVDAQDAMSRLRMLAEKNGTEMDAEDTIQLALLYEWMDRHDLAAPELTRACEKISAAKHLAFSISRNIAGYHCLLRQDYLGARQTFESAKFANQQCGAGSWTDVYTTCFEGTIEMVFGNSRAGIGRFEQALAHAAFSGAAISSAYLADAIYYRGDLSRAQSLSEEYLRLNRQVAPPDVVILNYRTAARLSFLNNNLDHAELMLTELGDIGDLRDLPRLKAAAWLEKSRLALLCGDTETADRYFKLGSSPKAWASQSAYSAYTEEIDDLLIASCRMELVLGEASKAATILETAIDQANSMGRRWRKVRLQCLVSQAYARMGKQIQALDKLEDALLSAAINNDVYVFADEPWCLVDLLQEILTRNKRIDNGFVSRVLERTIAQVQRMGEVSLSKSNHGLLTPKETALLRLVAEGRANKEIARLMNISDNTVETHLRRINQKFETKNRTQAVTRAREAGLIR
jgi:LuxR family maltose regulon positive regulatory protein